MKKYIGLTAFFFFVALSLDFIFFNKMASSQFLYIGDQFFRFSYSETFINSFFIRKLENLSVLNGWQFTTQFWDVLYYLFIYKLHFSFIAAEKILFGLLIFLSLSLSFLGFEKIYSLITDKKNALVIVAITLWYCFNPYSVELWHGGVYILGTCLTYSLAPLIFYCYHTAVFTESSLKNKIICAILMSVAAYAFWLFAPFVFMLIIYTLFYLLFNFRKILLFLKNILLLLMIFIPLVSFVLFNILYEYFGSAGNNNATFMPTFGNEQGGFRYQLLMLFSWGIYTVWTPRAMYPFYKYYLSNTYIQATLALYAALIIGAILHYLLLFIKFNWKEKVFNIFLPSFILKFLHPKKKRKYYKLLALKIGEHTKLFTIFLFVLFISLFLAKASQPPYGDIFLYLYNHVPFFSVFRTADIRFGFCVVLSISFLLVFASRHINRYLLSIFILTIMFYQSPFFFNGTAIQGENIKNKFYDRVIYYSKDYTDAINYLNRDKSIATYILPLPAVEYGNYTFDTGEHHFGQDFLPKLVQKQFTYLSLSNGTYTHTYQELNKVIKDKKYDVLKNFPIKYIILRHDMVCADCLTFSEKEIGNKFQKVFKNKLFTIYRLNKYPAIINGSNISFRIVNPIKYRVHFDHVSKTQSLQLLTSFNKDWKIYLNQKDNRECITQEIYHNANSKECKTDLKFFEGDELTYLWKKPFSENTHHLLFNYANSWQIDPKLIKAYNNYYSMNKDGSINFDMVIYYQPQSWFYLSLMISGISLIIFFCYVMLKSKSKNTLKNI